MGVIGKIYFYLTVSEFAKVWSNFINQSDFLVRPEPRIGINPFTQEEINFESPETTARVQHDNKIIGDIYLSEDESPYLWVECYSEKEILTKMAIEIAEHINCDFKE